MNQHIFHKSIEISQIDFADSSYVISPEKESIPDESLTKSIARYGILHPPIIKEKNSGFFVIVAGRKRLHAFRKLFQEKKTCACMVIPQHVSEIETFFVMLEETTAARQLTPAEKALFLQKISPSADEEQLVKEILPRLNLPPVPSSMKQFDKLLTLEEPLILAVHRNELNETVAQSLAAFSQKDRLAVFEIISSLQLNTAYQKKLLNICLELASREKRTIALILAEKEVQDILSHKKANPPQKTKNLMNWLVEKQMPRSRKAEEEFKRFASSLHLPRNISMDHTPFFEDDSIKLSITFSNKESLQKAWKKIKNGIGNNND